MSIFVNPANSTAPDLKIIIGMKLEEAIDFAKSKGLVVRLAEVDGEPYSLESTFSEQRVNLKVEKGIVVEAGIG